MKGQQPTVVYVTREIERALGMAPSERYRIGAGSTPYGQTAKERYPDLVTLIEGPDGRTLGTGDLLAHEKALSGNSLFPISCFLLVFKNTARIELIAHERGWKLINSPPALAERIENKVSQISWLG